MIGYTAWIAYKCELCRGRGRVLRPALEKKVSSFWDWSKDSLMVSF